MIGRELLKDMEENGRRRIILFAWILFLSFCSCSNQEGKHSCCSKVDNTCRLSRNEIQLITGSFQQENYYLNIDTLSSIRSLCNELVAFYSIDIQSHYTGSISLSLACTEDSVFLGEGDEVMRLTCRFSNPVMSDEMILDPEPLRSIWYQLFFVDSIGRFIRFDHSDENNRSDKDVLNSSFLDLLRLETNDMKVYKIIMLSDFSPEILVLAINKVINSYLDNIRSYTKQRYGRGINELDSSDFNDLYRKNRLIVEVDLLPVSNRHDYLMEIL